MPTRLIQLDSHPSGTAALRVTGTAVERLSSLDDLEIAILQPGQQDLYLDARNPDHPWSTAVFRFRPLEPRREGAALLLDVDYGVTYHLRANQPYKLKIRQGDALEIEERFTGSPSLRRPSAMPQGWTPPPDPRGPLSAPAPAAPAVAQTVESEPAPVQEPALADASAMAEPTAEVAAAAQTAPPAAEAGKEDARSHEERTETLPEPVIEPKRTGVWVALAVLLVALVGGGAWWMWRNGEAPPIVAAEADESLDSVRRFLAGNPEPAAAREKAEALAASGRLLDAQFLLAKYAAERGDHAAARLMGTFYDPHTWSKEKSPLPAPNPPEAARWHRMAAEAGDAEAQFRYALLLRDGGTDEPNGPELAVAWLRKAAAQGHAEARKALGE
jgi:hypothetical protein